MLYFDASALVKRYVREQGSSKVRRLLSTGGPATCRLSGVEVASALVRRSREGAFSTDDCDRAFAALAADMSALLVVELTPTIESRAQALLRRHVLRAGDAIQLASCLEIRHALGERTTLVAFDHHLLAAAHEEGLVIE